MALPQARQTDRLVRIGIESFDLLDELYGRPKKHGGKLPPTQAYNHHHQVHHQYNVYRVPQAITIREPVVDSNQAAQIFEGMTVVDHSMRKPIRRLNLLCSTACCCPKCVRALSFTYPLIFKSKKMLKEELLSVDTLLIKTSIQSQAGDKSHWSLVMVVIACEGCKQWKPSPTLVAGDGSHHTCWLVVRDRSHRPCFLQAIATIAGVVCGRRKSSPVLAGCGQWKSLPVLLACNDSHYPRWLASVACVGYGKSLVKLVKTVKRDGDGVSNVILVDLDPFCFF
ncbi:hypothetical protein WN944_025431 [Citrus x changshan-huyou]|uniref:Uncharacterized protein n=1 Tax=Citrus x changshan-huyou TaxID=2935761 RepID=A0AAP0LPW1_9ROSI